MAFDQNALDDFVFDLLNVAGVTASVSTRIYHRRVPAHEEAVFPLAQYQIWNRFKPSRTIGGGRSSYKGSYRVIGYFLEDPRGAKDFSKAIEEAMIKSTYAAIGSQAIIDLEVQQYIYDEKDMYGDGKVYIMAGAIYDMEVTA